MADATLETIAACLELLPVQLNRQITAQDLRDIINSLVCAGSGKWEDLTGSIEQATGNAALTEETYRDTPFRSKFLRHDQADELSFTYQMTHQWNRTGVRPHIHVEPMAAGSGSLVLTGHYAWAITGEAIPAFANWTPFTMTKAFTAADQYKPAIIAFDAEIIPPESAGPSAMLMIHVKRDTALDTYETSKPTSPGQTAAANVRIVSFDTHVRRALLGTDTEF